MTNPTTVFVSGIFNVLHPGHLRLFKFARELGEHLVIGVLSDHLAAEAAQVPQDLRLEGVGANNYVDEVLLVDVPVESVVKQLRPDFVVKGREHELHLNPELEVLDEYGGQLVFSSGEAVFSSMDLIGANLVQGTPIVSHPPTGFLARHGIDPRDVVSKVNGFSELQVCVIGDLIVDEYLTCDPLGMSQEDPTLVVTPIDTQRFLGGSAIIAAHVAELGAKVHYLSVSGNDGTGDYARGELDRHGVDVTLLTDETRPTTLKQRFRADGKTLLRVSHLHQGAVAAILQEQLLKQFSSVVPECQLVVFSDFNYGCLPQSLVEDLVIVGHEHGVMMAADSQSSSQVGDVSRFRGMDLLTPTEHEARVSLRNHEDGLVVLAEKLKDESRAKNILLKLGSEGVLLHIGSDDGIVETDRVPALNMSPRDPAGAGDALLVVSAMAMAAGSTPWEAAYIGAVAAAFQVSRIGNIPLTQADLIEGLL